MWLAVGTLWLVARLPHRLALWLGDGLGRVAWHVAPYRRHITDVNLRLCFPELDAGQRRRLAWQNFRYTGRGLMEVGIAWWGSDRHIRGLAQVEGLEHVHRALEQGRGVILLGAHFTPLDLTGRLLLTKLPFQVIYRADRNPVVERMMRLNRERHFERAFERRDMRALVRALRDRRVVWYPPDQDYGPRHSVFAPFFGVQAATITMTSRLARLSGAAVIPAFGVAREDGRGYRVRIHPPLEGFPSGDDQVDAARINAALEAEVRRFPAQYYWVHRRFKTRPDGQPRPYNPKRRERRKERRA